MTRESMIDRAVRAVFATLLPEDRSIVMHTFARFPQSIAPMFVGDVRRAFREIRRAGLR